MVQKSAVKAVVDVHRDGHLILVLPPGEEITEPMALEASDEISRLAKDRKAALLLVLTGIDSLTRGAREVFGASRSMVAVAVLGATPVDRVIANFLIGGEVQPCPTRYFSDEEDAVAWLGRHMA